MRKKWFDEKSEEGYPVFVASVDSAIVGFSSFGPFRRWEAYKFSVENSLYVAGSSRGKGIGTLLLNELIQSASQMNKHTIIAGIDAENQASISLHRSFGFLEVAHFRQVGYKFNRWLDLKFFQLILNTPRFP
jgi:phosphinothricin acetyltransferase